MSGAIDYKALLRKYIAHVESCEGANFIARANEPGESDVHFSAEEIAALKELTTHDDYA